MNKKLILLFTALLFIFSQPVISQSSRLKIKSLETAVYYYNFFSSDARPDTRVKPDVQLFVSVDSKGMARFEVVTADGSSFYSLNLPDDLVAKINTLFDGKKRIRDYQAMDKAGVGMNFSSTQYHYLKIVNPAGAAESLCFINASMPAEFNTIMVELTDAYKALNEADPTVKKMITPDFLKQLNELHIKTKPLSGG